MSDIQNNLFTSLQGNQPASLMATSSNPLFNETATNKGIFWIIKISLMFINAFTAMICIFIVLFGFAYPEEKFPGDLKGKTCALLSIVCIGWSLIGYCGAHHQKVSFLLVYSGLVVFYVFTNIIVFGLMATKYIDQNLFWIQCSYFTILMAIGLLHAYQIRLKEERIDDLYDPYNYGSTFIGQLPNQQFANQLPLYNATANMTNQTLIDNTQMYNMPNYNLMNNQYQQQPTTSIITATPQNRGNYFQRNWQRMSSKRNFFRSSYRPSSNGNLITTELKPMPTFNTTMPQPY